MKSKKLHKWTFTYAGIGGVFGMLLGQLIKGSFSMGGLLGSLFALLLIFLIDLTKNKMKKDKTPDFDERTQHNMTKYYAILPHVFIGIVFVGLGITTSMGVEQISVHYLWGLIFVYFMISGIGALLVSRR
jgi:hypothetical protein